MCHECPLQAICDERVKIAGAITDMQIASYKKITDEFSARRLDFDEEDISAPEYEENLNKTIAEGCEYIREGLGLISIGFSNILLVGETAQERFQQIQERAACNGPKRNRRYGRFGKVITVECGSEKRKGRLKNHMERLVIPADRAIE